MNKEDFFNKQVKLSDVDKCFRELWGVFSLVNEFDAKKRKELLFLRRRDEDDDSQSFPEYVISHFWNKFTKEQIKGGFDEAD